MNTHSTVERTPIRRPGALGRLLIPALALALAGWASVSSAATSQPTSDHNRFKLLQGSFTIEEVNRVCIECHNLASEHIYRTIHWTWDVVEEKTGQRLGKRNVINNFFISAKSNSEGCTACHISFPKDGAGADFAAGNQVDCLICHDTTGTYAFDKFHREGAKCSVCHDDRLSREDQKPAGPEHLMAHMEAVDSAYCGACHSDSGGADMAEIAQQVGLTSRKTCGTCHFRDGGGDGVKHGDLDSSLFEPDRSLDVHMDAAGLDFSCATCHKAGQHEIRGSLYARTPGDSKGVDGIEGSRATCTSCHGNAPMNNPRLNDHTDRIACQTCHIPRFARGGVATQVSWDWSAAGRRGENQEALLIRDEAGRVVYNTLKGESRWRENVVPRYLWFNGTVEYTLPGQPIDDQAVVPINVYRGGPDDPSSRIFPVKVADGRQPFDTGNRTMALPKLLGEDDDAYWQGLDWQRALATGMAEAGFGFSGQYGFIDTRMLLPINHMVAPATEALDCESCHARDGLLADIEGVYIPRRDLNPLLEMAGMALLAMTLGGALIHALFRVLTRKARRNHR